MLLGLVEGQVAGKWFRFESSIFYEYILRGSKLDGPESGPELVRTSFRMALGSDGFDAGYPPHPQG